MHRNDVAWTIGRMAGHSAGATDVDFATADVVIAETRRETAQIERKHCAELAHQAENLVAAAAELLANPDQPETERSIGALRALAELWNAAQVATPVTGPQANPFVDAASRGTLTGLEFDFDFATVDPDLLHRAETYVASVYTGDENSVISAIGADFIAGYRARDDYPTG